MLAVELVKAVILKDVHCGGALLVFLPGMQEISALQKDMLRDTMLGDDRKFRFGGAAFELLQLQAMLVVARLIPLHSSLSSQEQQRVFETPPTGCTKIVRSRLC